MDDVTVTPCAAAPTEIEVLALTTYEVAPDGSGIRMNMIDADGNPARMLMPVDCLRTLAVTMPKMISDTVSGGRGDPSIRIAHSVESWYLERSTQASTVLLTMETGDRLRITFALSEADLVALADGISTHEAEAFAPELRGH